MDESVLSVFVWLIHQEIIYGRNAIKAKALLVILLRIRTGK